jgi:hypothetical protein
MTTCIDFTQRYTDEQIRQLQTLHTKQLLKKRDLSYICSELCCDSCSHCVDEECNICIANEKFNREQIKTVLATREHVPNKRESKAIRKQRIKEGK